VDPATLRRLGADPAQVDADLAAWAVERRDALLQRADARAALRRAALHVREVGAGRELAALARTPPPPARHRRLGPRAAWVLARRHELLTPALVSGLTRLLRARARAALRGQDVLLAGMVLLAPHVELVAPRGRGRLVVGPWCWLGEGTALRAHEGRVTLGPKVVLGGAVTVNAHLDVSIGEGALLADRVHVTDADHRFGRLDQPIRAQGMAVAPVRIGPDVWLGHGVTVLRGVDIGRGTVVGAHAVVTRDLPPFSVAVGAPARVVRSRLPAGVDPHEAADLVARGLPIPGDPLVTDR